jgi:hypothetical protein
LSDKRGVLDREANAGPKEMLLRAHLVFTLSMSWSQTAVPKILRGVDC